MTEKELLLDYWNNFRHFDDGLKVFLATNNMTREIFNELYSKFVDVNPNPWLEDKLKSL